MLIGVLVCRDRDVFLWLSKLRRYRCYIWRKAGNRSTGFILIFRSGWMDYGRLWSQYSNSSFMVAYFGSVLLGCCSTNLYICQKYCSEFICSSLSHSIFLITSWCYYAGFHIWKFIIVNILSKNIVFSFSFGLGSIRIPDSYFTGY